MENVIIQSFSLPKAPEHSLAGLRQFLQAYLSLVEWYLYTIWKPLPYHARLDQQAIFRYIQFLQELL